MILITFAVPFESAVFRSRHPSGKAGVTCLHTGVGSAAARQALERALEAKAYSKVVISGFAGGLLDDLRVGDLITNDCDEAAEESCGLAKVRSVRLAESAQVLVDPSEKREFARRRQAEAVDMETSTLRQVCREHAVPAVTLRVISDDVRSSLVVPAEILSGAARQPVAGTLRLLGYLALRPARWGPFRKMVRDCATARASLATGLLERISGLR